METSGVNLNVDIISVANKMHSWVYLLLTEFEVRTEVTHPRFFLYDLWPAQKTRLVRFLFYLYCVSVGFGNDSINESGLKQNESIWNRF